MNIKCVKLFTVIIIKIYLLNNKICLTFIYNVELCVRVEYSNGN